MDPLYKIIKQLSEDEFQDIYQNLTSNKAEKSALFLQTIRTSDTPVEDFLEKQDISASAFYVLKSRLNQKVESFLLNRLGDPKLEAIHKVFKVYELIFSSPREIALTTLKKLEKTMLEMDNPNVLMVVYRALKMLYSYDDDQRVHYDKLYNQAVAFYLTTDKAMEGVMNFFRIWDKYYLTRRDKDYNDLIKSIEKVHNVNNLYQSQRLYICRGVVHLFAQQFMDLPSRVLEIMDEEEESFDKCFGILERNTEDILFKNLNLIFDFLRYAYYSRNKDEVKETIYFELLDYKIEELLTGFNFGMDCSWILFAKLQKHRNENTLEHLHKDIDEYLSKIEVDTYRVVTYVNFNLFTTLANFYTENFETASRILYKVRNEISLRKYPHIDIELKLMLALLYVIQSETDLANQLILSLQRQLKKQQFSNYDHARLLLKILTNRQGGRSAKKLKLLEKYLREYNDKNRGRNTILPHLELNLAFFIKHTEEGI